MPTYEYECPKCGHTFEKFQSIKAAPLKQCPQCRGRVKRLLGSGAGLLFKGSGFYITDYRSEGYKQAAKADVKPAETKAPEAKPAAETKPAAHAEKKAAGKHGKGKAS